MQSWPMPELQLQYSANTDCWLPQLPCKMNQRQCSETVGMPACGITYRFFSCTGSFSKMKIESGLGCYCLVKSCLDSLVTPWTIAHQASLSMGFFRQEYRSGQPFPSPTDLPDPGMEPQSPALQADSLLSEPPGKPLATSRGMFFLIKEFDSQGKDHLGNFCHSQKVNFQRKTPAVPVYLMLFSWQEFSSETFYIKGMIINIQFSTEIAMIFLSKCTNYPLLSFIAQRKKKLYNSRHFVQERRGNEYHMACLL